MNESVRNEGNPLGARDSNVNAAQAIFWADLLSIRDATHEWFAEMHGSHILDPTNRSTSDSIAAHLLEVSLSLKGGNSASGRKKPRWVAGFSSFSTAHLTQNQSRSLDAIALPVHHRRPFGQ
jgi:hypothetical protein